MSLDLPEVFEDLLLELADAHARFLVVGGYAVAFHGHARATKDLDVWIRASQSNAPRVLAALRAFGAPVDALDVSDEDFASYAGTVQFGVPPLRIDVLTAIDGVTFDEAWRGRERFFIDDREIPVIGLRSLVKNKLASGRAQDVADVEALRRR